MDEESRRNQEAATRAERHLKEIPSHWLGPAGQVLLSNAMSSTKQDLAPPLRGIEGRGKERQSPSQQPLIAGVDSE